MRPVRFHRFLHNLALSTVARNALLAWQLCTRKVELVRGLFGGGPLANKPALC